MQAKALIPTSLDYENYIFQIIARPREYFARSIRRIRGYAGILHLFGK